MNTVDTYLRSSGTYHSSFTRWSLQKNTGEIKNFENEIKLLHKNNTTLATPMEIDEEQKS